MSTLATLKLFLTADTAGIDAGLAKTEAAAKGFSGNFNNALKFAGVGVLGLGIAVAAIGAVSIKMAGDFQQSATQLVTGAGESQKNLALVTNGILDMAGQVGTSAQTLIGAMYTVESAGHHGADGLLVLKAATEGAKAGNADLTTVTDALTSVMASYHETGKDAISVTNQMIATESAGKLHMEQLAASLSAVVPLASSLNISFAEVGGAIATMTNHGESAEHASQNLANAIHALASPSQIAVKEMAQMGISAVDVAQNLGKKGLSGTIDELQQAVINHMGPAGLVLQSSFNQSKAAASDALTMLSKLPPNLKALGQQFLDNKITQAEFQKAIKGSDAMSANLARQFEATAKRAMGFSDTLKSGSPAAKTFASVMSDMMGGSTGLNVALMLGGENMPTYKKNVEDIGAAGKKTGKDVEGWSLIQGNLNFKLGAAAAAAEAAGIKIGTKLLPYVNQFLDAATPLIPVVANFAIQLIDNVTPAAQTVGNILKFLSDNGNTLKPIIVGVAGAWGLWNAGLLITKGYGIVAMIWEFISGMSAAGIASNAMAVAQWALDVAMDANPVGILIIAIAALAAGIIWAYNNVGPFHNAVNALGDGFRVFVTMFWADVKPIFDWLGPQLRNLANLASTVGGAVGAIFGGASSSGPSGNRGIGGHRASGGPVLGGSPYLIGEQGPELFVPSTSGNIISNSALSRSGAMSGDDSNQTLMAILHSLQAMHSDMQQGADISGIRAKLVALIDQANRGSAKGVRMGSAPA